MSPPRTSATFGSGRWAAEEAVAQGSRPSARTCYPAAVLSPQVTHGLAPAWHVEQHRSLTYRHASKDAVDVDPEAYALSREFMETFAEDNFIMVTWANYHYLDFGEASTHQA